MKQDVINDIRHILTAGIVKQGSPSGLAIGLICAKRCSRTGRTDKCFIGQRIISLCIPGIYCDGIGRPVDSDQVRMIIRGRRDNRMLPE